MARIIVKGGKRLQRNLALLGERASHAVRGALFEVGEDIVGDAKELSPVDFGTLRASGFVWTKGRRFQDEKAAFLSAEAIRLGTDRGNEINVSLGFGGPAVRYAEVQHERTDFRHTVGQAKYLETPFMRHAPNIPNRVAQRVDREVRKLGVRG